MENSRTSGVLRATQSPADMILEMEKLKRD
jgi:hypothetical protein